MFNWLITETAQFAGHAAVWDRLVADNRYPAFMQSRFIAPACTAFLTGEHRFALGRDGERIVAAAILVRRDSARWSTFQPSQLPMGAWVAARDVELPRLLAPLCRALPGVPLMVSITQQDPVVSVRPEPSEALDTVDYIATAWIEKRGSYEDFWEGRGKNLKQNLRKQRRKLEAEGRKLSFEVATTPERVAAVLGDFATLESHGWKSGTGTAIAPDNSQGRFYAAALGNFAATGDAICCALRIDGAPVAADLCVRDSGAVVVLKTTYDENFKSLSPGQLLHEDTFRHLFADPSLERIEFFGRVMDWHTRWTENVRTQYHVNYYRWAWLKALHRRLRARAVKRPSAAPDVSQPRSAAP